MKFASLWAEIAHQNIVLRLSILGLSLVVICFGIALAKLSLRDPLVIERPCTSPSTESVAKSRASEPQTNEEIKVFITEAISMRFDSNAHFKNSWFSDDQIKQRKSEQEDLEKKKLAQKVFVESIDVTSAGFRVTVDRLLSVGKIRSAVAVTMDLKLERTPRTASNPYGLVLTKAVVVNAKDLNPNSGGPAHE